MNSAPVLAFTVVLGIGGAVLFWGSVSRRVRQHVSGRVPLSHQAFGATYFSDEHVDIASKVHAVLASYIVTDVSLVHPDDQLVKELCIDAFDGMAPNAFIADLEATFSLEIPESEITHVRTLLDLVEYLGGRLAGVAI